MDNAQTLENTTAAAACSGSVHRPVRLFADSYPHLVWNRFEDQWAVYRLIARNGRILYVGVTKAVQNRIRAHRGGKKIPFYRAEYTLCRCQYDAQKLEREMVETLMPPYNTQFACSVVTRTDGTKWKFYKGPPREDYLQQIALQIPCISSD
jgi:hypothetical protein